MAPVDDPTSVGAAHRGSRTVNAGFGTTPFARLARTHFASVAGDAMFVIAMASSVFFNLDFNEARWRVALFLVLTLIPFAVVGPFLGPAIDRARSGRRLMIFATAAGRALLCFLIVRHEGEPLFYIEAFGMLVLGKTYHVAKSAIVPTTVRSSDELVEANSKLALSSAVAGVAAAAPAAVLSRFGLAWVLGGAVIVFATSAALSLRIAKVPIAELPPDEAEKAELRGIGIRRAAEAIGTVRGAVGFLSFLLAFTFKDSNTSMGAVLITAQGGVLIGAAVAPRLRAQASEERIITGSVAAIAGVALLCGLGMRNTLGAAVLSLVVGSAGSAAKQSFDALVQRDAPDANFGRQFAKFESRFQLFWCGGALVPVVINPGLGLGFAAIGCATLYAAFRYVLGARRAHEEHELRIAAYSADAAMAGHADADEAPGRFGRLGLLVRRRSGAGSPRARRPRQLTAAQLAADARVRIEKLEEKEAIAGDHELARETEHLLERLEFRTAPDTTRVPPPALHDDDLGAPTDAFFLTPTARPVVAAPLVPGADPTEVRPAAPLVDDPTLISEPTLPGIDPLPAGNGGRGGHGRRSRHRR
jgi:hypothetical protein